MHKFKMKSQYNKEELSGIKTELLNSKFMLPLAILVMIEAVLASNALRFLVDTSVDNFFYCYLILVN